MNDVLVIQSYGSENEYRRAILSILSFYAWSETEKVIPTILFSDNPEYFRHFLTNLPIRYIRLTSEKLKSMRGEIDFVHRVKIAAIDEAFQNTTGNLLYVDSDTFFIRDPSECIQKISPTQSLMHVNEYVFEAMKLVKLPAGKTFHVFYDFVMNRAFSLTDGTVIRIAGDQVSWNAGVIMLHQEHRILLKDVFKLTEDFYPATKNHGCEQYAFSIVLSRNTRVLPSNDVIYHYWIVVKKTVVDLFLESRITTAWGERSLEERLTAVKKWTRQLPGFIENHFLMLQYKAAVAFNDNDFGKGYGFALRALFRQPFNLQLVGDILYHTKRKFTIPKKR